MLNAVEPESFVEVKYSLAVASGLKAMPFCLKLLAQLDEVVDLAVSDEDQRAIFVVEGLKTTFQVDNAQPAHCKGNVRLVVAPLPIRPAMNQGLVGCAQLVQLWFSQTFTAHQSRDSTHLVLPYLLPIEFELRGVETQFEQVQCRFYDTDTSRASILTETAMISKWRTQDNEPRYGMVNSKESFG
jgi:hypothetical protein